MFLTKFQLLKYENIYIYIYIFQKQKHFSQEKKATVETCDVTSCFKV